MIGDRKIIAVCVARIQDEATHQYITELNKAVSPKGYSLFVYNTCSTVGQVTGEVDPQFYIYDYMDYAVIDAVIIFEDVIRNAMVVEELIHRAKTHGKPVIVMGERHEGCINIKYDEENGFADMVRHMIEVHHMTKLHFMAGIKGNQFSEYRLNSFKKVLQEYGLPADESRISYGDFWTGPAEEAMERLIASGDLPQAVLCANDRMAMAVCSVLQRHGLRVPEDVAVTGYDGIVEISFTAPRITSVICDAQDLAGKTVEVLQRIHELHGRTETFLSPLRLCIAETCGCYGETTQNASDYMNKMNDYIYRLQNEEIDLAQITEQILRCENVEQVAERMKHPILYDMCCVVEKDFVGENAGSEGCGKEGKKEEREMLLLFDSDIPEAFVPYSVPVKEIIPHLHYMLENNRVMVFNALHHVGVPMGYVCFFFSELNRSNYMKIPQTANALNSAIGGYRSLRQEHALTQRINEMYKTDTLTGLYNRRGFVGEYRKMLETRPKGSRLSVIMADLDYLKQINDRYGHKEGDFAIHATARALEALTPEGALCTRFGGDEMLAVCIGVVSAEKVKAEFEEYFRNFNENSGKEYNVEVSVGVYVSAEDEELGFEELVEKSDTLMYAEKKKRKSQR